MINRWLALFLLLVSCAVCAEDTTDGEDFEEVEEGMKFDVQRYGLFFKRNLYVNGDNVTTVIPGPTEYNDTRDVGRWKPYVSHWVYEPPGFIVVYINDDSPHLTTRETEVDLLVTIAAYDRARNLIPASTVKREGVLLHPGINRVPINIHVYNGDILSVRMQGVRQKIPIMELDVAD